MEAECDAIAEQQLQKQRAESQWRWHHEELKKRAFTEKVLEATYDEITMKYWVEAKPGTWKEVQGPFFCLLCEKVANGTTLEALLNSSLHRHRQTLLRSPGGYTATALLPAPAPQLLQPALPASQAWPAEPRAALPDGSGSRIGMFSARFDGGPMYAKFRRVHALLRDNNFNVLMVDAKAGDDFGMKVVMSLDRVRENRGVMICVCTKHYGEKTSSPFSTFDELHYAQDYRSRLEVLPLRVEETYPPSPPCGPEHMHDKEGEARAVIRMVLRPNIAFIDCRDLDENEIAWKIAEKLLQPKDCASLGGFCSQRIGSS